MSNRLNLVDRQFDRLTVISFSHTDKKRSYWVCRCICGNTKTVQSDCLTKSNVRSCGCLKLESSIINGKKLSKIYAGCNKKSFGEASFNVLFQKYKFDARKRDFCFDLSKEYFFSLVQRNCFYCNIMPYQKMGSKQLYGYFIYNGIDRLDNKTGYTLENCVACCGVCNKMKRVFSYDDFISKMKKILNNLKESL